MTESIKAAQTHATTEGRGPPSKRKISHPQLTVLSSIVETSTGRDKALKCLQYAGKNYIYLIKLLLGMQMLKRDHMKKLSQVVSSLSLARFVDFLRLYS